MAEVGTPVTPIQLNAMMGPALKAIDTVLNSGDWKRCKEFLDATPDADLMDPAGEWKWTQDQVNLVKAAFNETQGTADDWNAPNGPRFFAKQIWGL